MIGFDTSHLPYLDFKDEDGFKATIEALKRFFLDHREELEEVFLRGRAYLAAFDSMDPFIQSYTARICPSCGTVCCAQRHGMPEYADIVGMLAMGVEIPSYTPGLDPRGECQFMGPRGCVLSRPQRPYRCTWYFCDPILLEIDLGPMKEYRFFLHGVQELSRTRGEVLRSFVDSCKRMGRELPR